MNFVLLSLLAVLSNGLQAINETNPEDAISAYAEQAMANMKLRLHKAAQRHEGQRRKRSIELAFSNRSTLPSIELQIASIEPIQSIPTSFPITLQPFKIDNTQYLAVVNFKSSSGEYKTMSEIYKMKNGKFVRIQQIPTSGCVGFEYAELPMENLVIFVNNVGKNWLGKPSYSQSFQIYKHLQSSGLEFEYSSSVGMHGGKGVTSFMHDSKNYFVAVNSYANDGNKHNTKSILYLKTQLGFLRVQQFETHGAQDAEVFVIGGLVYIAFANYKDNEERVDIYSTIYREKRPLAKNGHISFEITQKILTHGARDFQHFKFRKNHYLVVANERSQLITFHTNSKAKNVTVTDDYEVDSVIYWWSGTIFVEWQRIPTNGAVRWSSFNGPNGGMMLVVANSRSNALIYTYDAIRGLFKATKVQGLNPIAGNFTVPDVRSVQPFTVNNETYLAVANFRQAQGYNIFKIKFVENQISDVKPSITETLTTSLNSVKAKLRELKRRLAKVQKSLLDVMTTNTNQTITGIKRIRKARINKLKVGNLIYTNHTVNNPIEDAVRQAMQLRQNLTQHGKRISYLQDRIRDAVTKNTSQNITGTKTFQGFVKFSNLSVNNLKIGLVDGVNVTDLARRAWSKTKDQKMSGNYHFVENVTVMKDLDVSGLINNLCIPEDVMTTNTQQNVTGKKLFAEEFTIYGNITTKNFTINGMNIPEDLVLKSSNQIISGSKVFKSRVKFGKSVAVDGLVNGKDLMEFSRGVVTLATDQTIVGKKTFARGFHVDSDVRVDGLVDGVNLTELNLDAVRLDVNETIKGKKWINGSVTVNGNLETKSTTNGYRLQDDVMTTNTFQVIPSKKIFHSFHVQGNIETNSTIDGIDLSREAVTKSGDQKIYGKKTFENNVTLNGDMQLNGTIDGVDVVKLDTTTAKKHKHNIITASKIFTGKIVINKQIFISGKINNVNLKELRKNIMTKDGNQTIVAAITFENLRLLQDLNIKGKLNGVSIPEDLVLLNKDTTLVGNITFADKIVFEKNVDMAENGTVNGKNLQLFANSVVLNNTDQQLFGKKVFKANLTTGSDLNVNGLINNASFPFDFVSLNTEQNITGIKRFTNSVIINGELSTGVINVSTTINDIYISDLLKNLVYKDRNETVRGNVVFAGSLKSKGDVKVGKLVDGINVTELKENIVLLSKPQNISGVKTFLNDVEFNDSLTTPGQINGINLTEIDGNSLKKRGNQTVSGVKIFEKTLSIKGNFDSSTINGINLKIFEKKVVKKTGSQTITGNLRFVNNASFGEMNVTGKVDGLNLSDLLLTFGNQTITGRKTFANGLKIVKNVKLKKKLNGLNLTHLDENIMKIDKDQNVSARLVFNSDIHVNGSIEIKGLVNGVDISELNLTSVHRNENNVISGNKTFTRNVTIRGNVIFQDTLNNVNMTNLLSDAVLKSKEQVLCADKYFTSKKGLDINATFKATNLRTEGLVNGVDIVDLDRTAVKVDKDQTLSGNYTFEDSVKIINDVVIKGHVNNINVSRDIMLKYGDQTVSGYKKFKNLVANGNINVTGKVDGVDVSEFAKSRVTLSTNQTINGVKSFNSAVTIKGNFELLNNATVNGIDVSEELLVNRNPQLIEGGKTFEKVIKVLKDMNVDGTVNELNLTELERNIVRVDDLKTLTGITKFLKNIRVLGDIKVDGTVNGFKINEIYNDTKRLAIASHDRLNSLNDSLRTLCRKIKIMTEISGAEIYLTGIERIGKFSRQKLGQISAKRIGNIVYITIARLAGSGCGPAYILRCSPSLVCSNTQVMQTRALNLHFHEISGQTYLFAGHWGSNATGCPSYPEILRYDENTKTFVSYFNITKSLPATIKSIRTGSNVIAFIPPQLLTSVLFTSPITTVGSILTRKPAIKRTFINNGTTYLVTASVLTNIEVFMIDRVTLDATKIQQITTQEIFSIEVGMVNNKTMLACAEGRHSNSRYVKIYLFVAKKRLFYFYQRITVSAVSVTFSTIHSKHYLVFASPEHGFGLCPWRGVEGFGKCLSVPDVGIHYIQTVVTAEGVFAVGTTNSEMVSYKAFFEGLVPKYNETLTC